MKIHILGYFDIVLSSPLSNVLVQIFPFLTHVSFTNSSLLFLYLCKQN